MYSIRAKTLLFFLIGEMLLLTSCNIPKKTIQQNSTEYEKGYQTCQKENQNSQKTLADYIQQLERDNALKTAKLRQFNLVDESGKLRTSEVNP